MAIATITFGAGNAEADGAHADILDLHAAVVAALDRHFGGYDVAAEAQEEYRRVRAEIAADAGLFGWAEALRAGLAARPQAQEWAEFERDAAAGIEPHCFSIRFQSTA